MPMRLAKFEAWLKPYGVRIENPGKGSHHMARKDGFRAYPLPAHNGCKTELSDLYIRG